MNHEHVIADEVLDQALIEFSRHHTWLVYNTLSYFLEKTDVYFFKEEEAAREFAANNISEWDAYKVLYAGSVDDLLKQIVYGKELEQHLSNTKKNSIMNEKNFEYLKDNIKYMGFGEMLNADLENGLKSGLAEFQLSYSTLFNKKPFEVTLNFRKSDNADMYFFNSYHASLQQTNGQTRDQVFYLTKGKGVTAKEAYNLLEGRPVFKELSNKAGEPYKAWIQLDFDKKDKHNNHEVKQYHENYGYDLKGTLSKYAISEMDGGDGEKALLQSLQKGNIQSIGIEKEGRVTKMFVEANPQYKSVTLYDTDMKRVPKESLEQHLKNEYSQKTSVSQEQKQEVSVDKKQSVSKGLEGPSKSKSRTNSRSAGI